MVQCSLLHSITSSHSQLFKTYCFFFYISYILGHVFFILLCVHQDVVEIRVTETNWNKTSGLCGRMDGYESNELLSSHSSLEEFASTARVLATGGRSFINR